MKKLQANSPPKQFHHPVMDWSRFLSFQRNQKIFSYWPHLSKIKLGTRIIFVIKSTIKCYFYIQFPGTYFTNGMTMKKALGFNRKFSRVTVSFLWLGRWLIWNQLIFCKITYNCYEFEVNYITLLKKVRKMTFTFPSFEQINTVIIKYMTKKWDEIQNWTFLTWL